MSTHAFIVIVDGEEFGWERERITGADLRALAAIPENAQIYLKVSGKPDQPVSDETSVDLVRHPGPARFSTQSPGSQAG